jgi:MFS family permease
MPDETGSSEPLPRPARAQGRPFPSVARALRHRNYRLFFMGQGTSLIGTWLTRVATAWLVYRLTGSAMLLGVTGFAGQIPAFLIAPAAGVLVDRWNRHRVLLVTQTLAMVQSGMLAALTLGGVITVWHVIALALFQGAINSFDMPARQAFVVQMVESREDLPNAIALNSSMVNAARLVGPSLAGFLIAAVGEGWCFAIDAVSYIAVLASLAAMRIPPRTVLRKTGRFLAELGDGLRYASGSVPIRAILLLLACVSLVGMPYMVLMPVFAARVFGGGAHTLGVLMACAGAGAMGGALWLASRRSVLGLGRTLVVGAFAFGGGLVAFSFTSTLGLAVPALVVAGAGMMVQMASSNTLIQTLVDEDMRGRVMSLYAVAFFGMAPFGSLLGGWLGGRIGAPEAVRLGGGIVLLAAALFLSRLPALRRSVRPIYVRLGIIAPDAEAGSDTGVA